MLCFFCFKQKTEYEVRISDWSSDVCSSDLDRDVGRNPGEAVDRGGEPGEGQAEQHPQRHREEDPQGQIAVEKRETFALRLRHRISPQAPTRLPASSTTDRKSTRLNSSHQCASRMPSSARNKKKQTHI